MAPNDRDRQVFESAVRAMEAEIANVAAHLTIDPATRLRYQQMTKEMSNELRQKATRGQLTWKAAAAEAHQTRQAILDATRARSTPVGRARAQQLKQAGPSLNEMIARKTLDLHGANAKFTDLTSRQKNVVYAEIVKSAGKSNARVNAQMRTLSRAGRGLIVLSLALSVYTVATAEDKADAAAQELAVTGAGIGGGIAGGAVAGLACGPGAPMCVAVGAFVGGAIAAFGVDLVW